MINNCKECGCTCKHCGKMDNDIHLHLEIENLKQKLAERDSHIIRMETNFLNESSVDSDEVMLLKDELASLQDKHKRLSEAHKRVQRVNQGLEDKLLKLVDACETDKSALTKDVAVLSEKLAEANYSVKKLTESNERYKKDVNVAIQFLQCKQSNFVAHKFDTLPPEIQSEVSVFMNHKKKPDERKLIEPKSIKVPIPTFPPTAMFYSVPKSPKEDRRMEEDAPPSPPAVDVVSAAIMAKVLEERQRERMCVKHCDTCTCSKNLKLTDPNRYQDTGTQTEEHKQPCNNCKEANFQILKLPRSSTDIANTKVTSFETENCNNVVKVQPNNFLVEKSSSNASSLLDLDVNLNSDSTPLNSNLPTLNSNTPTPNSSFSTLNSKNPTLKSNFSTLNSNVPTLKSNFSTLNSNVPTLNSNVPTLKSNFSTLNSNAPTLNSNFSTLSSNIPKSYVLGSAVSVERNNRINRPRLDDSLSSSRRQEVFEHQPLPTNFKFPSSELKSAAATPLIVHSVRDEKKSQSVKAYGGKVDLVHAHKTKETEATSADLLRKGLVENEIEGFEQNFDDLDRSKYQEMEENVKRFLFKKTELWKEQSEGLSEESSKALKQTFSHTQTEI